MDNVNVVKLLAQGENFYKRRTETVEHRFTDAKQHHGLYQEDSPCAMGFFALFMVQRLICGNGKNIHKTDRLSGYLK